MAKKFLTWLGLGLSYAKNPSFFTKASGYFALGIGVMVILGWYGQCRWVLQMLPNLPSMLFNTALGFILFGAGLILLTSRHSGIVSGLGGAGALLGLLTLGEYLSGRNFGIDQLFCKSDLPTVWQFPGRMSPLTASCFTLLGAALLLTRKSRHLAARLTAVGILTCIVAMIAGIALAGFALEIDSSAGWVLLARMAVHTAATFLVLSTALLIWAWYEGRQSNIQFLRWLPVTASVMLMIMISFVAAVSFSQLKTSNNRRDHSYKVLSTAQTYLADLLSIQKVTRDYALSGQSVDPESPQDAIIRASERLDQLKLLTQDDASQQERIRSVASALSEVIVQSNHLIDTRVASGIQAALRLESNGQGATSLSRAVATLLKFTDEERRLLSERSLNPEIDIHNTESSLITGTILAALLLVAANLMTGHAIARQKVLTQTAQAATIKAQAAERVKSEFLAVMSHEIRTPMNGVIGMASILADTQLTDTQRDYVNTISQSGESLMIVINNILDFSKIEAGKMRLDNHPFNLQLCVEEALDLFAPQIRTKALEAVYFVASDIPPYLTGDAVRLRQILVNLIGNAIKFTSRGEIAVNVERQGGDGKGCHLLFSVTDTGIGIASEEIEKLFEAFQQVDMSDTRHYGGTGLGLVICKRLAECMGGTIWVDSKPGSGSSFFFSVTFEPAEAPVPDEQLPEPGVLASHSALIVDDNATNRRVLEIQLKLWGIESTSAASGAQGLMIMGKQNFDVVLIDFQMPEMDGVALAREIRKRTQTPLVLLSSSGEIILGKDGNLFQVQIPKPVRRCALFNGLLKIIGKSPIQPVKPILKPFDKSVAIKHPLRILLAEDNVVNQKVGLLMLARLGYNAHLAVDGLRALNAVEDAQYDLILMDIQMPNMNGIDAARLIREKLGAKCPSIFALTAEALEGDKERFLALGFDGYMSKPLKSQTLQEMLNGVKIGARNAL